MSYPATALGAWLLASAVLSNVVLADNPPPPAKAAATTAAPKAATPATPAATQAPLDLKAPPVEHVLPRSDLKSMVTDQELPVGEDVRVEKQRYGTDVPVGFFRAVPWALMHPTQAWRVFTPVVEP